MMWPFRRRQTNPDALRLLAAINQNLRHIYEGMQNMATKQQLVDAQKETITALGTVDQSIVDLQARIDGQQIPDDFIETQKQITEGVKGAKTSLDLILPAPTAPTASDAGPQ